MITLESKMAKAEQVMNDPKMIAAAIPAFADLISKTEEEAKNLIASSESHMNMFFKFMVATTVAMVSDKAAQLESKQA